MAKAAGRGEHDQCKINVTQNCNFIGLFDEAISTFREGDLKVGGVFYFLDGEFASSHVEVDRVMDLQIKVLGCDNGKCIINSLGNERLV